MNRIRILIVDDHEPMRRSIRLLLTAQSDWRICGEAADGLEAVEKAIALGPDLVLMDLSMPRMDGAAATRIIRQRLPGSEIILVSQNDPGSCERLAAQSGACAFVKKSA